MPSPFPRGWVAKFKLFNKPAAVTDERVRRNIMQINQMSKRQLLLYCFIRVAGLLMPYTVLP